MIHIYESSYKDIFAMAVETDKLIALFLPYNGAKLASLIDKISGTELLAAAEGENYKKLSNDSNYVDGECSAFDDMFPTIDLHIPKTGINAGISYLDHGEVCRSCFNYTSDNNKLVMTFNSDRLLYRYTKIITGTADGSIAINYKIDNLTGEPFNYIWAGHCMLAAAEDGRIITPYTEGAPAEIMFDNNNEYGRHGDIIKIQQKMLTSSSYSPEGNTFKYYFIESIPLGIIKYTNPKNGRAFVMRYDQSKIPYLGVWINNGRFKAMYNSTPEICTAPFDSPDVAAKRGCSSIIKPNGTVEFQILLYTEENPHE
ncbi:MAG: aldose epimerase family protein [Eubacteriales bacterium]